ncbi:MAG: hypothetical protein MK080_02240 [Opitutales bacterium]|nr:hypothetical protein [Opitutales bacterium]NRA26464.1 hypothetical protein [Opitutales bacterium]
MPDYIMIKVYNLLHFAGIFLVYLGYGGLIFRAALGSEDKALRKFGGMMSGIGLFLILLGGFGMHARLGYSHGDFWFLAKMAIFLVLGGSIALINRKPALNKAWFFMTLALGLIAAYMGSFKPTLGTSELASEETIEATDTHE